MVVGIFLLIWLRLLQRYKSHFQISLEAGLNTFDYLFGSNSVKCISTIHNKYFLLDP